MTAVFRHELRMMFSSLTAYVYGMFSLLAVAIYMMYYNLSIGYANFEYALAGASFALLIMIPIITMRIIAEEKKQKTDQLLYSLPISTTQVVVGKFLAVFVTSVIPLAAELRKSLSSDSVWRAFRIHHADSSSVVDWDLYFFHYGITAHGGRNLFCSYDPELLHGDAGGICCDVCLWITDRTSYNRSDPGTSDPAYDRE